jgi:hypothetical protein
MPDLQASSINLIGFCFILLIGIMMLSFPRRLIFIPILVSVCYITLGQVYVLMGLNFTGMRIIVAIGWVRLVLRQEIRKINITEIDKSIICWLICGFITYSLREQTSEALINRLGFIYNGFGLYFFFRMVIQDISDLKRVIKALVLITIPLTIALLVEKMTGHNIFSIFGGVPEYSWVRDGTIRAQGPFAHAILAGTFGAVSMPLFMGFRHGRKASENIALTGMIAATVIVVCAASSVSLFSYFSGLIGMAIWRFRTKMRFVQWSILFALIFLHIIMKAPVWHLLSRAGELAGGTGWHRAFLIDQAIYYFDEWWLLGAGYTAHWFPYGLEKYANQTDITNQYILQGIDGGILTMILFITVIVFCFKNIGKAIKKEENLPVETIKMIWSMGASLLVMVVSFFGVTYFDQMIVVWYLLVAMIANITSNKIQLKRVSL